MKENLNIVQAMDVYLPDVDGVINCMHNYSVNLCKKNNVLVAVPKNRKDYVDNFPYKITRCKSVRLSGLNQYYGFPKSDKKFKKDIMERDIDIIHVHSPFAMSKFMLKVAQKKNVPIVTTYHSNMEHIVKDVVKSRLLTNIFIRYLGKVYNKFDEVFVCSPLVEAQVRRCGYTGKVTYLPFGTDLEKCTNVDELREKADKELALNQDELVFMYLGRVMKLKRIDFILDSLKLLKDKGLKFKFFVVGKGAELNKLKKRSAKLGLEEEVKFLGFVARELIPLIYARADLFLFPSIYDNFALVKVEAAAYATPGLFIKGSCAGYEVTDGTDGFLSEDNVEAFAEKIESAVADRQKLKQIGENAQKSLYRSWAECAEILNKRLVEIVGE